MHSDNEHTKRHYLLIIREIFGLETSGRFDVCSSYDLFFFRKLAALMLT